MAELGRIENGFYVQGDLKFAVDPKDAHKTFDAVAALSNADKIKFAKLNGIATEPFNKQLITGVLKSLVQNAWFIATTGNLPVEVMSGHTARLQRYAAELAVPASAVDFLSKKTRAASKTRPTLKFVIDEAKYEAAYVATPKAWLGQGYLVIKALLDLGAKGTEGKTIREVFDTIKGTRETAAPSRNAVGQYVNKLVAAGIVTCLNPQDAKKKPTTKTPEAPKAPAAKTPPAPPAKKKH